LSPRAKTFTHAKTIQRSLQESPSYPFFAATEIVFAGIGDKGVKTLTGSRAMRKENFAVGQRVRLKWELDPPVSIPAGAIGQVTRVSPWDVWVRFEKRVVRLPFSDVEQAGFTLDRQRRIPGR
jgi:hypothetical protein